MPTFIAIAGGSGAGKSTLAYAFADVFGDRLDILHLDDYQKKTEQLNTYNGLANRDEPAAVRFDDLLTDLRKLRNNEPVTVRTSDRRRNPTYRQDGRIEETIYPREYVIIEGYLALHDKRVRELYDQSIFLDLKHQQRMLRRDKTMDDGYDERVLRPMHERYVEPTKSHADHVIDVTHASPAEVYEQAQELLRIH